MQQRRRAEVTIGRIQVRARVNEGRVCGEQRAQAIDVTVVQGSQRGVEAGVRFDPLDLSRLFDEFGRSGAPRHEAAVTR
jgi:hypothetical protein